MFNNESEAIKKYLNGEIPFKNLIDETYKEFEELVYNQIKKKMENDFNDQSM